jgi:hypothetical protein
MSYAVSIWNPSAIAQLTGENHEELGLALEQVARQDAAEADRALFSEFGQRLMTSYPSEFIADSSHEVFGTDLFAESQMMDNRLWNIGIDSPHKLRVLRDMMTLAKTLGLMVYDDQIGIGFDPKLGVVPRWRQKDWDAVLHGLDHEEKPKYDKAYVNKHINFPLSERLKKMGFSVKKVERGGGIICPHDRGELYQEVNSFVTHRYELQLDAYLYIGIPELGRIYSALGGGGADVAFSVHLNDFLSSAPYSEPMVFKHADQVDVFFKTFEQRMLPLIEHTQTIQSLDALINGELAQKLLPSNHMYLKALGKSNNIDLTKKHIVAGLANNPKLEEMISRDYAAYTDMNNVDHQRIRERLPKTKAYFRDPAAYERELAVQKQNLS